MQKYIDEIDSYIEEMRPLLDRIKATRRLRYPKDWDILDPELIIKARGWIEHIRQVYWKPCADTYMDYKPAEWDILLTDFGSDVAIVKQLKRQLSELNAQVTSNDRPEFFKISRMNELIKGLYNEQ